MENVYKKSVVGYVDNHDTTDIIASILLVQSRLEQIEKCVKLAEDSGLTAFVPYFQEDAKRLEFELIALLKVYAQMKGLSVS